MTRQDSARRFAEVIIPVPIEKPYTYEIPPDLIGEVRAGHRVEVQFGRSKRYAALVCRLTDSPPDHKTKKIISLIDEEPVASTRQFEFWKWMSEYYCSTLGEVMAAALPANLKLSSETVVYRLSGIEVDSSKLSDNAHLIMEALLHRAELTLEEVQGLLSIKSVMPLIHDLFRQGLIGVQEVLKEKYKPKIIKYVNLSAPFDQGEEMLVEALELAKRSEKQTRAILAYIQLSKTHKRVTLEELRARAEVTTQDIKALGKKGVMEITAQEVNRFPLDPSPVDPAISLSGDQQLAYDEIVGLWKEKDVVLLHGATGSGKTWIYKKAIQEAIANGQQVLFLLPEIALTVQIVERLQDDFGNKILVAHSGLNNNERADLWRQVQEGAPVVLGARSSIFLPFCNLGLVVIDEEHDGSYKQNDPSPRYHGRDSAIYLATKSGAKVLLGSATPAVESYFNTKTGKYGLVNLSRKYRASSPTELFFVDLRKHRLKKDSQLSGILREAISEALLRREQVIVFKNRRGYAPVIKCGVCGWQAMCDRCDIALTYHKYRNKMSCHLCGSQKQVPITCPACASTEIRMEGFGTQKIEDELRSLYPEAAVERMDYDTTRGKKAYENIIRSFERRDIDILVGTQMVTKGLDFDHVGLVGVIHADQQLYFPHFRAQERTFQLLVQVAGRAGRSDASGKVIIQTYNPSHPVFADIAMNDYLSFYEREIMQREQWQYPPYYQLIGIQLKHKTRATVGQAARIMADWLKKGLGKRVLGPVEPAVSRIRNQYLMDILIKIERRAGRPDKVRSLIRQHVSALKKEKGLSNVRVNVDVDPR